MTAGRMKRPSISVESNSNLKKKKGQVTISLSLLKQLKEPSSVFSLMAYFWGFG